MKTRLGFVANASGLVAEILLAQAVSDAYDILVADGMTDETAAELVVGAERKGMDPVAFARKTVRLRQSLREVRPQNR